MSANAIARHYAMLACGGELDGVRILSEEAVRRAASFQHRQPDLKLSGGYRRALGYFMGGDPLEGGTPAMGGLGAYGHPGFGGSIGFADPDLGLSFGLTKNLMVLGKKKPIKQIAYRAAELVRRSLAE